MAYDKQLAMQVRATLSDQKKFSEREMFGGVGFMIAGNMACDVNGDDLIVRVGPDAYEAALDEQGVKIFDMTGRPMRGWVVVTKETLVSDAELRAWVNRGVTFASTLPSK